MEFFVGLPPIFHIEVCNVLSLKHLSTTIVYSELIMAKAKNNNKIS